MSSDGGMKIKELRPVFTREQISRRVAELADDINATYGNEPLVVVCVLKGAFMFFSDLVRHLRNDNLELDFVRLSSYARGVTSSRHVIFSKDVEIDLCDKHVLIVEDIVDSGHSMRFLIGQFGARRVRSLWTRGSVGNWMSPWILSALPWAAASSWGMAWTMPNATACCPAFLKLCPNRRLCILLPGRVPSGRRGRRGGGAAWK